MALEQMIKEQIKNNCVMIFSKKSCPYCKLAQKVFDDIQIKYEVMELENRHDAGQIQDILNSMTGQRTVPRVFIGGKCIGGGTDTQKLHKEGKLLPMVQASHCGSVN